MHEIQTLYSYLNWEKKKYSENKQILSQAFVRVARARSLSNFKESLATSFLLKHIFSIWKCIVKNKKHCM